MTLGGLERSRWIVGAEVVRPKEPSFGMFFGNSTTDLLEWWDGREWITVADPLRGTPEPSGVNQRGSVFSIANRANVFTGVDDPPPTDPLPLGGESVDLVYMEGYFTGPFGIAAGVAEPVTFPATVTAPPTDDGTQPFNGFLRIRGTQTLLAVADQITVSKAGMYVVYPIFGSNGPGPNEVSLQLNIIQDSTVNAYSNQDGLTARDMSGGGASRVMAQAPGVPFWMEIGDFLTFALFNPFLFPVNGTMVSLLFASVRTE